MNVQINIKLLMQQKNPGRQYANRGSFLYSTYTNLNMLSMHCYSELSVNA